MKNKRKEWTDAMRRAVEIVQEEHEQLRAEAIACDNIHERAVKIACMAALEKAEGRIREEGGLPQVEK